MSARAKQSSDTGGKKLSTYQFDTSKYVVVKGAVRRDAATGHLVMAQKGTKKK